MPRWGWWFGDHLPVTEHHVADACVPPRQLGRPVVGEVLDQPAAPALDHRLVTTREGPALVGEPVGHLLLEAGRAELRPRQEGEAARLDLVEPSQHGYRVAPQLGS